MFAGFSGPIRLQMFSYQAEWKCIFFRLWSPDTNRIFCEDFSPPNLILKLQTTPTNHATDDRQTDRQTYRRTDRRTESDKDSAYRAAVVIDRLRPLRGAQPWHVAPAVSSGGTGCYDTSVSSGGTGCGDSGGTGTGSDTAVRTVKYSSVRVRCTRPEQHTVISHRHVIITCTCCHVTLFSCMQ